MSCRKNGIHQATQLKTTIYSSFEIIKGFEHLGSQFKDTIQTFLEYIHETLETPFMLLGLRCNQIQRSGWSYKIDSFRVERGN